MIPQRFLSLSISRQAAHNQPDLDEASGPVPKTPLEFTELVRTQILTNTTGIENAAQQTGLSPKTLQRKLQKENTSYSEIVDQLRLTLAQSKLENPETPIHVIAAELGYEHQANFTRAFKRMCGLSPLQYRKQIHH